MLFRSIPVAILILCEKVFPGCVKHFTGNRVDPAWWNASMLKDGKGLLPFALGALAGEARDNAPSVGIVSQRF